MKRGEGYILGIFLSTTERKFDSTDSNERFWQIFTNVKIRKTKIGGLEELIMLFRTIEETILNISGVKAK